MKKEKQKVVIKIGTFSFQNFGTKKIIQEIVKLKENYDVILVSSGAVGEGKRYLIKNNLEEKIKVFNSKEISTFGQAILLEKYIRGFKKHNILVGQILISKKINKILIYNLLKHSVLPIINGNDAEVENDLLFNDNDSLAGEIVMELKANRFIILTDVDAVYNSNPNTNKDAKKYKILTEISEKLLRPPQELPGVSAPGMNCGNI